MEASLTEELGAVLLFVMDEFAELEKASSQL